MGTYYGEIVISSKSAFLRDDAGRFLAAVDAGATAAVMAIADAGAGLAIAFAPKRHGILAGSIEGIQLAAHEAAVVARAPHAVFQEKGTGPHPIGRPGQWLGPGEDGWPGGRGPVSHPGNPATRFLARSMQVIAPRASSIIKSYMPG